VALRVRDVDVLTAQADDAEQLEDRELLDRATALGRSLFTQDEDLLAEGVRHQRTGVPFAGIIYVHQLRDRPMHQQSGIDCQSLRACGYGRSNRASTVEVS